MNAQIEKISKELYQPVVSFLHDLVSIRSYSCEEGPAVQRALLELEAIGCDEVWESTSGDAIGRIGSGKTTILYDAHLDTIEVADEKSWLRAPCDPYIEENNLVGLGACDCKGGVAAIVYGAAILKQLSVSGDFSLFISCSTHEEDVEGFSMRSLIEKDGIQPDYVIIAEPTDMTLRTGQRGRCEIHVRTNGRTAHASQPHLGESAITSMLPVIEAMDSMKPDLPVHPIFGQGDQTITMINSPNTPNSVPEWCEITIDRRMVPGETRQSVLQGIHQAILPAPASVQIPQHSVACHNGKTLSGEAFYPGWHLPDGSPLLSISRQTYQNLFGCEPLEDVWQCSTNGTYSAGAAGIPTIGFGPQELKYLHMPDERVNLKKLRQAAMFYALFPFIACRHDS